jgi:hypothetical protein
MLTSLLASKAPLTPSSIGGENTFVSKTLQQAAKTHYLNGTPVALVETIPIKHKSPSIVQKGIKLFTRKEAGDLEDIYPDKDTNEIVINPLNKKLVSEDKNLTLVDIYPEKEPFKQVRLDENPMQRLPPSSVNCIDPHVDMTIIYPQTERIPGVQDNLENPTPTTMLHEDATLGDLYHNPNDRDKNPQGVSRASDKTTTYQWNPLNQGVQVNMGDRYPVHSGTIPNEINPENARNASYWREVPDAPKDATPVGS